MGVKQALSFLGKGFIWQVQAVSFRECKLSALTCLRFSQRRRRWRRRRRLCDVQLSEDFMIFLHENFEDDGESKSYRREIKWYKRCFKRADPEKKWLIRMGIPSTLTTPQRKMLSFKISYLKGQVWFRTPVYFIEPPGYFSWRRCIFNERVFRALAGSSTWEKDCNLWCRAKNDFKRLWKCEAPVGNLVSVRCFTRKMWFQKIWFQKNICSW